VRGATRRILAYAALLHLTLAALLLAAGRAQVAPKIVDRDGVVVAMAADAVEYRSAAAWLADTLRDRGPRAWLAEAAPLHVRCISLCFAVLAPLFGYSVVAAEPFNLLCYLTVLSLVFAITREISGDGSAVAASPWRTGTLACPPTRGQARVPVLHGDDRLAGAARLAAAAVAIWPTFLLHSAQFLKDPLFIAGALVPVFIVVTWLTRDYAPRHAALAGAVAIIATSSLLLIRSRFAVVIVALVVLGLVLLVARQLAEKRLLRWNLVCALAILAVAGALLSRSERTLEKDKLVPSPVRGPSKSAAVGGIRETGVVTWAPHAGALDAAGAAIGRVRARYNIMNAGAGSGVDSGVELRTARDVAAYAPRAFSIGMFAPFPSMWLRPGRSVGAAGRAAAGVETLAMYGCELLALAAVVLERRRLAALLLLLVAAFGVTTLALVVSNLGTLYRFRYVFWILLIVLGVAGAEKVWMLRRRRALAVCIALLGLSCAHPADTKRLAFTNATGWTIDAIYLSPDNAPAWEENVLGGDALPDGESVDIRFRSRAPAGRWDMRVDGRGYYAEWKHLDLARIAAIHLRLGKGVALAELDPVSR
jgi:hypothetical protein